MNNIFGSLSNFNKAFDNSESKELDKLAKKINNAHAQSNNKFDAKYNGIVCDQLDCNPYSQQTIMNNSFFSAQGDYSPFSTQDNLSPLYARVAKEDSLGGSTFNPKVFSESDSFKSLSSSTYSSLPSKIKKKLASDDKNKNDKNKDNNNLCNDGSCNNCKNNLLKLLSEIKNNDNKNLTQKPSNSFLNLTNPEIKDVMVLILIGIIIIMLVDLCMRY